MASGKPKPKARPAKRARRRPVRPVNWNLVLGAALGVNILAGCLFSPLTSLRKVRVSGAPASSHDQIRRDLKRVQGIPYAILDRKWLESRMLLDGSIESFSFSGSIFGSAVVKAVPRSALAKVAGPGFPDGLVIDRTGLVFRTSGAQPPSRVVLSGTGGLQTSMLGGGWESGTAAALLARLKEEAPSAVFTLTVSEDSAFRAAVDEKTVNLGAIVNMDQAVQRVKDVILPQSAPE